MRAREWTLITLAAIALFQGNRAAWPAEVCSASARPANLDFTLHDVRGREVTLSDFRGDVVLINFWATWCAPCRVEIPHFIALHEKYRERGLVILGVSVDESTPGLVSFVSELKMTYPVLIGAKRRDLLDAFGPPAGFPTSFLISRDGKICAQHVGLTDAAVLERQIHALL
jgi:thiol-disulfide isomerase/thioredoxin